MNFHPKHPFDLPLLPPSFSIDELSQSEIIKLLIKANKAISELNGLCHAIPNPYYLLTHILPILESRDSSAIEGVYTTVETLLETQIKVEKEQDPINKEGLRYKYALNAGFRSLKEYNSLSTRTILNIHKHLILSGGQFKKQGNKIVKGTEIIYTPPDPTQLNRLMNNWEKYVHSSEDTANFLSDPLIKIIISHYQFEAVHPFTDGNGRTGRILMVLQMQLYKLLDLPVLYISSQLLKYRQKYYSCLLNVSKSEEWISLIKFFLDAFEKQARDTKQIILNIIGERKKMKEALYQNNLMSGRDFLDHIFTYPVTHATFMGGKLKLTYQTAGKHLAALEKVGLLKSKKSGTYKFYYNTGMLNCLKT